MDPHAFNFFGNALEKAVKWIGLLLLIFIPLGMWKLIEIIIWLFKHVKILGE